jgi:hypothetical protein
MSLFTKEQFEQLRINGLPENYNKDQVRVVKLFLPGTACTWLITQIDYESDDIAFGLCDLGQGFPEVGSVSLSEISSMRVMKAFRVERDLYFKPKYALSTYAKAARFYERIVEDETTLSAFGSPVPQ